MKIKLIIACYLLEYIIFFICMYLDGRKAKPPQNNENNQTDEMALRQKN